MAVIPALSPKHVPLSVEEKAQFDLIRILVKAGVSLQIEDKSIDWAYQYSLVNKLHNSGGGFWIRHNFLDREGSPF